MGQEIVIFESVDMIIKIAETVAITGFEALLGIFKKWAKPVFGPKTHFFLLLIVIKSLINI